MELRGKVALVTGGSDGIGRAIAVALARAGCAVSLCAREPGRLEAVAESLRTEGRRILALAGDVADRRFVDRLIGSTVDRFGTVDIVVNNAGIGLPQRVQDLRIEDVDRLFAVNVLGPLHVCQAALPALRAQRSGAIVNIASIVVGRPMPGLGAYAASKHALVGLSRALRIEVLRDNIDVIVVYPGVTATGFSRRVLRRPSQPPRGRFRKLTEVQPDRVARATVEAIRQRRSEVYITARDRLILALSAAAPWLGDRLIAYLLRR